MQEYCISVVIPVYNCEEHIYRCLKSLDSQDFEGKFEVIIVDDGSTDNTGNSCRTIISEMNFPSKLINQTNLGVSAARNAGIREAKGDYVIFVDGDDTLEPEALRILYQLAAINQVDMAYGCFRKVNKNGKLLYMPKPGKKYYGKRDSKELIHAILTEKILFRLGIFIIARRCILDNEIYFYEGCRYGEDTEFIINCLINVTHIYGTNELIYNYFENTGSVMNKVGLERFEFVEALKRLEDELLKVKNNRTFADLLVQSFIPYGILFHIDALLIKNFSVTEIRDYLSKKNYDTLLQNACLVNVNPRISKKVKFWTNNPETYRNRIHFYKKSKSLIKKFWRRSFL